MRGRHGRAIAAGCSCVGAAARQLALPALQLPQALERLLPARANRRRHAVAGATCTPLLCLP
jgi:hypothetical protein